VPLTVTTSFNINFLRKPTQSKDIVAVCKLIKVGRSLAVGEVAYIPKALTNGGARRRHLLHTPNRK